MPPDVQPSRGRLRPTVSHLEQRCPLDSTSAHGSRRRFPADSQTSGRRRPRCDRPASTSRVRRPCRPGLGQGRCGVSPPSPSEAESVECFQPTASVDGRGRAERSGSADRCMPSLLVALLTSEGSPAAVVSSAAEDGAALGQRVRATDPAFAEGIQVGRGPKGEGGDPGATRQACRTQPDRQS